MLLDNIIHTSNIQPRDYQKRIVQNVDKQYNEIGVRSVLIESPTGSGKTCMGLLIARLLQEQHNIGIGWVAMRRNLLAQAARENRKLGIDANIKFVSMFDKNPPTHDDQGRRIEILIVDEAQHDAANTMATMHNTVKPRWVLGLTATPFRTDRMKLCFDKVIKDIGIHQLIELGFLSKYNLYTVPEYSPDSIVETYLREPEKWGKSVMFWHRSADMIESYERLNAAGIRTEMITSRYPMKQREEILAKFEKGEIQVLTNQFILTEGFDSPSLKTVFVRDSQKGPTVQMAGRVFRKHPDIRRKQVVQSKMTHWPCLRTAKPDESFTWLPEEHEWRGYKLNPSINHVAIRATLMAARRDVQLPDMLKKAKARQHPRAGR